MKRKRRKRKPSKTITIQKNEPFKVNSFKEKEFHDKKEQYIKARNDFFMYMIIFCCFIGWLPMLLLCYLFNLASIYWKIVYILANVLICLFPWFYTTFFEKYYLKRLRNT